MPKTETTRVTLTFDRIGRNRDVPPVTFETRGADHLAEQVYRMVTGRPRLVASREVDVQIFDDNTGVILTGGRHAGTFTITPEV